MKILALLDGRPGNDNQTLAIAEKLAENSGEYQTLKIKFGILARLPNFLLGKTALGIKTATPQKPDLVIASGRKLARVAARMKAKTGCKAVQLMHPQMPLKNFDLIFVPEHDGLAAQANLHTSIGAPNRIDASFLAKQVWQFLPNCNVALIGDVAPAAIQQLKDISDLHITTSRRTQPATIKALSALKPKYMYEWKANSENPYYGLLAAAGNIIVSADSIGMISEACSTGKKVYIFGEPKKAKFRQFINKLLLGGYAKPMHGFGSNWQPEKLRTRDEVVEKIQEKLDLLAK